MTRIDRFTAQGQLVRELLLRGRREATTEEKDRLAASLGFRNWLGLMDTSWIRQGGLLVRDNPSTGRVEVDFRTGLSALGKTMSEQARAAQALIARHSPPRLRVFAVKEAKRPDARTRRATLHFDTLPPHDGVYRVYECKEKSAQAFARTFEDNARYRGVIRWVVRYILSDAHQWEWPDELRQRPELNWVPDWRAEDAEGGCCTLTVLTLDHEEITLKWEMAGGRVMVGAFRGYGSPVDTCQFVSGDKTIKLSQRIKRCMGEIILSPALGTLTGWVLQPDGARDPAVVELKEGSQLTMGSSGNILGLSEAQCMYIADIPAVGRNRILPTVKYIP